MGVVDEQCQEKTGQCVRMGKAMLASLEDYLRRRGHRVLMSSCVINELEPHEWHRHMGFSECGHLSGIPFDDGLGEVFLYKRLA